MRTILVSAYGCEPFVGSESGVGWNWCLQLAKKNKLYVITRANNKDKIEPNVPDDIKNNIIFYYYDAPNWILKLKRREKGLYFYYTCWQIGIIRIIKDIILNHQIDYTMHLSFGSFWMPTFLPLFNRPFIWGPLGGGDCVPKSFLKELPIKDRIIQSARYLLKKTSFLNPLVTYPASKARVILARTEDSATTIPIKYKHKVKVILETAMTDDIFGISKKDKKDNCLNLIYTGRLIPIKNVKSIVRAVSAVPLKYNIHLSIIGRGSEKTEIEKIIQNGKCASRFTLINEMPRSEVLERLSYADVYLFPSLHEGGSWALMEAMAVGLPVICLDCTGMHMITSEKSAIRIEPTNEKEFEEKVTKSIVDLCENPELVKRIGVEATQRIKDNFRWDGKLKFMEELFCELEQESCL